jgi:hypothetical protein
VPKWLHLRPVVDAGASFPPQQRANFPAHQSAFKKGRGANPLIFPLKFKIQCNLIVIKCCKADKSRVDAFVQAADREAFNVV